MSDSLDSFEGDAAKLVVALGDSLASPEAARARAVVASQLFGTTTRIPMIGRFIVLERLGAGGMGVVYAAFDPQLDRRVAIKVLLGASSDRWRHERLVSEAKAMAKLAHPNVVHVYEVGEHDGQIFIAMECVAGATLRSWCGTKRPFRDVLRICVEAGRGLAAAHSAGIVHGDFKPDNVIVGEDGRPRVLDFGLAQAQASLRSDTDGGADTGVHPWRRLGTPRYMAPEQLRDNPPDELSDQYAYCLSVWECLAGGLPSPTSRVMLPSRVGRLLRRGLRDVIDAPFRGRFASLSVLVDLLSRELTGRRVRVQIGLGLGALTIAFALGTAQGNGAADVDPCGEAVAVLDATYPSTARDEDVASIAARGGAYGAAASSRITRTLDSFAATWVATERSRCLLEFHGTADAGLQRRRSLCLHGSLSALASYRRIVARAGSDDAPRLVVAAEALPDPGRCAQPQDGVGAESSSFELLAEIADAQMLYAAGEIDAAEGVAHDALALARQSGGDLDIARALRVDAHVKLDTGRHNEAAHELFEATQLALRAGDHVLAIEAWGTGAWGVAVGGDPEGAPKFDGREWMIAIAASTDAGSQVGFFDSLGSLDLAQNRPDLATESFTRAYELAAVADHDTADIPHVLQGLALAATDPAIRNQRFAEAVEAGTTEFGAEHPRTLDTRKMWAANLTDVRASLAVLAPVCDDYSRLHPGYRKKIASCHRWVMLLAHIVGDAALALAASQRWSDAEDSDTRSADGHLALHRGDARGAVALLEPEVTEAEASIGPETPFYQFLEYGFSAVSLGLALRMLDDPRAEAMIARGAELIDRGASGRTLPSMEHYREYARVASQRR